MGDGFYALITKAKYKISPSGHTEYFLIHFSQAVAKPPFDQSTSEKSDQTTHSCSLSFKVSVSITSRFHTMKKKKKHYTFKNYIYICMQIDQRLCCLPRLGLNVFTLKLVIFNTKLVHLCPAKEIILPLKKTSQLPNHAPV